MLVNLKWHCIYDNSFQAENDANVLTKGHYSKWDQGDHYCKNDGACSYLQLNCKKKLVQVLHMIYIIILNNIFCMH